MAAPASKTPLADLSTALSESVARFAPGLASIGARRARSTGFAWRPNLIITADESLADEESFSVILPGGDTAEARLVGRDPSTDVALLRVDGAKLTPVTLASTATSTGALALVVGAAEGAPTAALGVVSRTGEAWRSLRGGEIDARIELDVRLPRGGEGSLVVDVEGQAIGMAVLGPRRRLLVIPAATIDRVAAKLESDGRIARGYLGLGLQPVSVEGGGAGAMVMSVDPNGPGAAAGVRQGDILVTWDGQPVGHVSTMLRALGPDSVGKTVALGLRRAGEDHQISLTVAERPPG